MRMAFANKSSGTHDLPLLKFSAEFFAAHTYCFNAPMITAKSAGAKLMILRFNGTNNR